MQNGHATPLAVHTRAIKKKRLQKFIDASCMCLSTPAHASTPVDCCRAAPACAVIACTSSCVLMLYLTFHLAASTSLLCRSCDSFCSRPLMPSCVQTRANQTQCVRHDKHVQLHACAASLRLLS